MKVRGTWRAATALALAVVLAGASPLEAYLKLGFSQDPDQVLRWGPGTIRYFVGDRDLPGVSGEAFRQAVGRAFASWEAVPTATATFDEVGFTGLSPLSEDGVTTVGFEDLFDFDERVLAVTSLLTRTGSGEIIEADIAFNAAVAWSTDGQGGFDVESIAVHEIGHLLGLGHSAIGETELRPTGGRRVIASETAMFPIAFSSGSTEGRLLQADDRAGVSDLYPTPEFQQATGSISGRVQKGGASVVGAHVVAFNLQTEDLVGSFTVGGDGRFVVAGLPPGPYLLRVEPLDDADPDSFFDDVAAVDVEFRVGFASRIVTVRAGADAAVDLEVVSK
ncbi:MAG: matrixin family metalloprotease [Vicinamibacterales bacterium]|nr:hypothetical protein [Acidobacteriota bacterium]MDP6370946.1 matrixin family metalloprotease [Vicinamibacterales bacterium]MDP6607486.1 matrixin family metalloprotease [Vicinamibacterales bacterium]HAK55528.1 hypothetical protein [Acidobacteriota bacterium]